MKKIQLIIILVTTLLIAYNYADNKGYTENKTISKEADYADSEDFDNSQMAGILYKAFSWF